MLHGCVFVASNADARKVNLATDAVITIAGAAGEPGARDGEGGQARLDEPLSIAVGAVTTSGEPTIFVGEGSGRLRWLRKVQFWIGRPESASGACVLV